MLAQHAEMKLTIEGHTDSTGTASMNHRLAEMRATAVRAALIEWYRVESGRLIAVGRGGTQPVGSNQTPEGRQTNRRVEPVRQ